MAFQQGKRADVKTIILYRGTRTGKGETTVSTHLYISNLPESAGEFWGIIRGHWSIENRLHWILDVCLGEDGCQVRQDSAAEILNVMRKTALYPVTDNGCFGETVQYPHENARGSHQR
jgi:predicted transposase YbfD/YdcC